MKNYCYKLWDGDLRKVIVSRDVTIDESPNGDPKNIEEIDVEIPESDAGATLGVEITDPVNGVNVSPSETSTE